MTLPVAAAVQPNETSLRAADAEELRIVLTGDADAMRALTHPNYIVNSPVTGTRDHRAEAMRINLPVTLVWNA